MSRIVGWCLKNKSVVLLAAVLLIGGGGYSATQLNQELLPDIEFPLVTVQTPVPGAGPDLVDEQVTQEIESAVEGLGSVESLESNSTQGFSFVAVEFSLDTDTDDAEQELQSALEGLELPEQAGSPEVSAQSASDFPVVNVSLEAGDRSLTQLTEYAETEAVPNLEEVDGVGSVELLGGSEQQIKVDLDTDSLKERGVPAEAVVGAISGAGGSTPVGEVEIDGLTAPVVTETGLGGIEALRELPVGGGAAAVAAPVAPSGGAPSGAPSSVAPSGEASSGEMPSGEAPEPVLLKDVADVSESEANLAGISRA
ncbi:hypothetical protein BH24ACT16_BH24ACT16_08660 [soil metagenome]